MHDLRPAMRARPRRRPPAHSVPHCWQQLPHASLSTGIVTRAARRAPCPPRVTRTTAPPSPRHVVDALGHRARRARGARRGCSFCSSFTRTRVAACSPGPRRAPRSASPSARLAVARRRATSAGEPRASARRRSRRGRSRRRRAISGRRPLASRATASCASKPSMYAARSSSRVPTAPAQSAAVSPFLFLSVRSAPRRAGRARSRGGCAVGEVQRRTP